MMKPYESYKKTNTPWLEKIPSHWEFERIGMLFSERKTKVSDKDYLPLSVTKKGIVPQLVTAAKSDDGDNRKMVSTGDFVVNSRSDRKGSSGISTLTGSVSLINIVLEPRQDNNRHFMHHLLKSNSFIEEYYRNGRGIVADLWTTRFSEMKTIMLPVPPRTEQDQIVRFLDWQLSKINKLITAKKRQIALLSEQKQAIINCAVTKGGNVWREISLGNLGDFRKGFGGSREDDKEDGAACIRYGDIYMVGALSLSHPITTISHQSTGFYSRVYKDEMLFALSGETKDEIGQALVNNIENDTWTSGDTGIFTAKSEVLPRFLSYALRCPYVVKQRASLAKGDIIVHISTGALKQLRILIPPISEQEAIIVYLDQKCNVIEKLIEQGHAQITLLNEYQTSLVSYVVTGKVNVRDVVVPEIDIIDGGEITDDAIETGEVNEQ